MLAAKILSIERGNSGLRKQKGFIQVAESGPAGVDGAPASTEVSQRHRSRALLDGGGQGLGEEGMGGCYSAGLPGR